MTVISNRIALRREVRFDRGNVAGSVGDAILHFVPGSVIAGGYARWALRYQFPQLRDAPPPGDIDVFLLEGHDITAQGVDLPMHQLGYVQARAGEDTALYKQDGWPDVQIIARPHRTEKFDSWATAWDVIKTFGFTVEMFALHLEDGAIVATFADDALRDTEAKALVVNHIISPIRLAYRANKYGLKGFKMSLPQMQIAFHAYDAMTEVERKAVHKDVNDEDYRNMTGKEPRE